MFTLPLDFLPSNIDRQKIKNILKIPIFFSALLHATHERFSANRRKKELSEEERREEERRGRERRGYDPDQLASHMDNKRYSFCAINEHGMQYPLGAIVNIIIVHGQRGYGLLYKPFAEFWTKQNYNVVIIDRPGHGNSKGERCQIYDMKDSDECIRTAIVEGAKLNPHAPFVFIDFSMGAIDVLYYLLNSAPNRIRRNVIGVASLGMPLNVGEATFREAFFSWASCSRDNILELLGYVKADDAVKELPSGNFSSWLSRARDIFLKLCGFSRVDTTPKDVPAWKIFGAPLVGGRYLGRMKIKELSMDKENISHDPKVVEEIWNDPMIFKGPLTARTGYIILKKARNVAIHLGNGGYKHLGFSTYFARGALDTVAREEHYKKARISIISYPGMKHEILKGSGSEAVISDIALWIKEVVLPTWPFRKQKRALSNAFFKKLAHREKETTSV